MKFNAVLYQNELNDKVAQARGIGAVAESLSVLAARTVYEIDSRLIDFVEQLPPITPLPLSEKFVMGACHARGRLLTVLDFSLALGGQSSPRGSKLIAMKGRDLAITALLASEEEKKTLPSMVFNAASLGDGARFFAHLS